MFIKRKIYGGFVTVENSGDLKPIKDFYAILGSGGIGLALAKELENRHKKIILVDKDSAKVETLKEQNLDAVQGDIGGEEVLTKLDFSKVDSAFIVSSDIAANKRALQFIKNNTPRVQIVVRAQGYEQKEEMEGLGADFVFIPSNVSLRSVATGIVQYIEKISSEKYAKDLKKSIIEVDDGKLAVVIHDNPDPDAISSAMALVEIAKNVGVRADILYKGQIGHHENKAFVNLLDIDLNQPKEFKVSDYRKIAMVECSVPGVNNLLPPGTRVSIVIDHHQMNTEEIKAEFVDIRPNIGATATIMTKYLKALEIPIRPELATALLHGIRVDTKDFRRNTDPADFNAAADLYPLADHDILGDIDTLSMSTESIDVLGEAIKNRQIKGSYLISNVGTIRDRDTLSQAADFLLSLEGVTTTIIFGLGEDHIYVSGRSRDPRINLGKVMRDAYGENMAGGHNELAGAQIPLGIFSGTKDKQALLKLANDAVVKRFLSVVGIQVDK